MLNLAFLIAANGFQRIGIAFASNFSADILLVVSLQLSTLLLFVELLVELIKDALSLIQFLIELIGLLFSLLLFYLQFAIEGAALVALTIILHYYLQYFGGYKQIKGESMTTPTKIRQDEDERLLEEYIRMKPSRAIDRLLSEYSIDKGFLLYNMLQEKIKRNTAELRSTLTNKYENLVDCSNLLTTIKQFTDEIEIIQQNITQVFRQNPQLDGEDKSHSKRSVISRIEERLFQKKYGLAIAMTYESHEDLEETQLLYLPMLRIQILTTLEEEIIDKKFTKAFIAEIIKCLSLYIEHLSSQQRRELISNERSSGEILSLIAETLESKGETASIIENDIIQIIFRCKLLSLNRQSHKQVEQEENISKFFSDIYQLINQKERDSEEISHLSAIFCKNYHQIEAHLLETFIVKEQDKTINFRYELYEKLATSEDFMETLQNLYQIIAKSYPQAPRVTLRQGFLNLWENYYNQLIHLLFKRSNPISYLPSLVIDKQQYPKQISKFICSDDLSIQSRIKLYQNEVESFFMNINKLIKETSQLKSSKLNSSLIIEQIIGLYGGKIESLNTEISNFIEGISLEPTLNKLGSLIYLFMYCDEFNNKITALSNQKQYGYLKDLRKFQLIWNYQVMKQYHECFYDKSRKQTRWSINFDHFFMKYYNPLLKDSKREIIKSIVLILLEGTMQSMDRERTEVFLSQKQKKRQREEKEQQEKRGRLTDISTSDIKPSTFAKKKPEERANAEPSSA